MYKGQDYYQSGTYQVGNRKIKDHNGGAGWGSITFDEGVERSSNVAFAILGDQKLGPERFRKYIHSFGLDEKRTLIYQVKDRIQFYLISKYNK